MGFDTLRNYYGKSKIGSITGTVMALSMIIAFFGPWFAGYIFDAVGSYSIAWIVSIAMLIIGIPTVLATKNPQASRR